MAHMELHAELLTALGDSVQRHSGTDNKPLDIDLCLPYQLQVRVYIFTITHPTGGRTVGEHKIQLSAPGQKRHGPGNFARSDDRMVLLMGYQPEMRVFALWDAGLYSDFPYCRNVQISAATIHQAFVMGLATQERRLRVGYETVVASDKTNLKAAIEKRIALTLDRLTGSRDGRAT